jgi:hypothetical protein
MHASERNNAVSSMSHSELLEKFRMTHILPFSYYTCLSIEAYTLERTLSQGGLTLFPACMNFFFGKEELAHRVDLAYLFSLVPGNGSST